MLDLPSTFFRDVLGRTVMHIAAERGSVPAIRYILSTRKESLADEDKNGRTPLHWAAACGGEAARPGFGPPTC